MEEITYFCIFKSENMLFRIKWLLILIAWSFSFPAISQDNLLTGNVDFVTDVTGWGSSGFATLSHDTIGALTVGSARIVVDSVDGDIRHSKFQSGSYVLPDSVKGSLLFFTFYARAFDGAQARIRLWVKDDVGNSPITKSSYLHLDTTFQKFSFPIHTAVNSVSLNFVVDCGLAEGEYHYDDFSVVPSPTPLDKIRQFDDIWEPRFFQRPDSVVPVVLGTGTSDIDLFLNLDSILTKVSYTQFGVNSNMRSGDGLVDRSHLYEQFGAFRYPAGSGSNQYFWDCNIPDTFAISFSAYCGYKSKFLDPDHFLTFRENARGEPTIVVNYFYARYGVTPEGTREARVQQAADYAASWVNYFNVVHNADIKYWEIGNECYGSWETGYNVNGSVVTGKEYGEDLCVFADAMKAVDPGIRIGAVLSHSDFEWNNQVMKEAGDKADFLVVHHYFTVDNLSASVYAVEGMSWDMQELQASAYHYAGKPEGYFPVAFTEFNNQGKWSTSMMNGLYVADVLGNLVKNRFFMSTIWLNEWNVDDYDSHGILAKNDPYQANYTARPSYTPYYYYGKCFGDVMIDAVLTGNDSVKVYASKYASGEIGVVLLNYSGNPLTLSFSFNETTELDSVFWYSVYADNLDTLNTKFYVNGLTSTTVGGGPADLDTVFAYGARFESGSLVPLNKYSATYLVLKKRYHSPPGGSWNGAFSNDWSTAYNWDDGRVPDSTTIVTVPPLTNGNYFPDTIIHSPAICKSLIIKEGARVRIPEKATLIIKDTLQLNK
jgi:hypothetical protein